MKQIYLASSLFLFFTGTLSSVQAIEKYTDHYRTCADIWVEEVQGLDERPHLAPGLSRKLEAGSMVVNDRACPDLLPSHRNSIRSKIDNIGPI